MPLQHPFSPGAATTNRQLHREGEQRPKSFLFSLRTITSFTATTCRDPEQNWWGAERKILPSSAKKRAEIFLHGHLHAFVCVQNPQPCCGFGSYGDVGHGRDSLPLIYDSKCHHGGRTCIRSGWQIQCVYIYTPTCIDIQLGTDTPFVSYTCIK